MRGLVPAIITLSWAGFSFAADTSKPKPCDSATKQIEIVEMLAHSDEPYVDAFEIYNPSEEPVDLKGWQITDKKSLDDQDAVHVVRDLPGKNSTILGPKEYYTFRIFSKDPEDIHLNQPGAIEAFGLKAAGDDISIFDANDKCVDQLKFKTVMHNTSYGYFTNSIGDTDLVPLERITMDASPITKLPTGKNSGPKIGPVIITEFRVGEGEFIEIKLVDPNDDKIKLHSKYRGDWRVTSETIDFSFPYGATIEKDQLILLVKADDDSKATKKEIRKNWGVPKTTEIYIYTEGSLLPNDEIQIKGGDKFRPNNPEDYTPEEFDEIANKVEYYKVDKVKFKDAQGWQQVFREGGAVERKGDDRYGNEPKSWRPSASIEGTPGR